MEDPHATSTSTPPTELKSQSPASTSGLTAPPTQASGNGRTEAVPSSSTTTTAARAFASGASSEEPSVPARPKQESILSRDIGAPSRYGGFERTPNGEHTPPV
ncbi:hypothetical protein QQS21_005837 [Conoideocrella luteorostrata]|uniref:Uncharacterized protein n=1 Tax=Conoideocrella luteorostrata TaxID=1105319 RepID=A0AAJ0CPP0_9HYPO|nr:hypothetical protein QQS21_005837 [Conoideocrella luteorostrata]